MDKEKLYEGTIKGDHASHDEANAARPEHVEFLKGETELIKVALKSPSYVTVIFGKKNFPLLAENVSGEEIMKAAMVVSELAVKYGGPVALAMICDSMTQQIRKDAGVALNKYLFPHK